MEKLEFYKDKIWRSAEQGLIDEIELDKNPVEYIKQLAAKEVSKTDRLVAFFGLIRNIIPEGLMGEKEYKKILHNTDELPFNSDNFELTNKVGRGGECNVYLLESQKPDIKSIVLKIDFPARDNNQKLIERAKSIKNEYETIKSWYGEEMPDLVQPEQTVILKGLQGKPSVATLQEFFGKDIRDLFSDFKPEELDDLLIDNPNLKQEINVFTQITNEHYKETGEIVDIFGDKNLAIINHEDSFGLRLLDPHHIFTDKDLEERPELQERLKDNLAVLNSIKATTNLSK